MLTQVTDSVAACPTDHHSPEVHAQATSLHRYLCNRPLVSVPNQLGQYTYEGWNPRYPLSHALGERCLVGLQTPCIPGETYQQYMATLQMFPRSILNCPLSSLAQRVTSAACCLWHECLKAIPFLSPAKLKFLVPSYICMPCFSCFGSIPMYRTLVK